VGHQGDVRERGEDTDGRLKRLLCRTGREGRGGRRIVGKGGRTGERGDHRGADPRGEYQGHCREAGKREGEVEQSEKGGVKGGGGKRERQGRAHHKSRWAPVDGFRRKAKSGSLGGGSRLRKQRGGGPHRSLRVPPREGADEMGG